MSEPPGCGAAWTEERSVSEPPGRGAAWTEERSVSEPPGRGAAWTEERGTSDEGRRRLQAPRKRAGDRARATREGGAFRHPGGERGIQHEPSAAQAG